MKISSPRLIATVLALVLWAPGALAAGAWNTYLRPYTYNDLLGDGDTLWCATLEGGLLRFTPSTGHFTSIVREPNGLASNRTTTLALDRSRHLWVGTQGAGLSVLSPDRSRWDLLNGIDGLLSDSITVLTAVGDTLWIGTTKGLTLMNTTHLADPDRGVGGSVPDPLCPTPFASNYITGVAILSDTAWVATRSGIYLSSVSGTCEWAEQNTGLVTSTVDALVTDGQTLLALDASQVQRFDIATRRWVGTGPPSAARGMWNDFGTVAVACSLGVYRWNGAGWDLVNGALRSRPVPANVGPRSAGTVFAVGADRTGRLFAANRDSIYLEPAGSGPWPAVFPADAPPGNNIHNIILEGSRLYVTTDIEGIGRYADGRWKYWPGSSVFTDSDTTFRAGLFAYALLVDRQGRKWVGCWDSALEQFVDDGAVPSFTHWWPTSSLCGPGNPTACTNPVARHTFAWCAALDSSGGHWFGMDTPRDEQLKAMGVEFYDASGAYVGHYSADSSGLRDNPVHGLTVDRHNTLWVGLRGNGGIDYFTVPAPGAQPDVRHVPATDHLLIQGLFAHGDSLWALTTSELRHYDLNGNLIGSYDILGGAASNGSRPLEVARDGTVWVGTTSGIRVFRPNGSTEDITVANSPLADADVRAIQIDPATGAVWIATVAGINRYDPSYVPPPPPSLPELEIRLYPNPARISNVGLGVRLAGNGSSYSGEIYDLSGRRLHAFNNLGNGTVFWNGRDDGGSLAHPGIYFLRVAAGGRTGVVRFALVR
jgi:ligand-binding sensor domain-containing protein